jgi:hypothetical protein
MNDDVVIVVQKTIHRDAEYLKSRILDIRFFEKWWSRFNSIVDCESMVINFMPLPYLKLKIKVIDIAENSITYDYIEGPLRGIGRWEIQKRTDQKSNLICTVRLNSRWIVFRAFIKSKLFKWKHSRDILGLMESLRYELS